MTYFFDPAWRDEMNRLRQLEQFFDVYTHADLEELGIRPGWRCLEIGAGGGSVAEWLAWRVGPTGRVVATDINTRFLEHLRAPNLEVRRHDVVHDSLEDEAFDLIHTRAVLEHVVERERAFDKMIGALCEGGWLLVECADFVSCKPMCPEHDELFLKGWELLHEALVATGFDAQYGRRVSWVMRQHGLEMVTFKGRMFEWGGECTLTQFYNQTFERLAAVAREQNAADTDVLEDFLAMVRHPDFRAMSHVTCSVKGRKAR